MPTRTPQPHLSQLPAARLLHPAVIACFLLGASCEQGAPRGQVVAVVNGEEITTAALNEEARARNVLDAAQPPVRAALLQDLVDRKLLAQKAIEQKLDRSPRHLVAVERMKEALLAQDLLGWAGISGSAPTEAELLRYIAANPMAFERRTILSIEQITFPRFSDPELLRKLETAATLVAIDALLTQAGVPRERLVKTWDSAIIPEAAIRSVTASPQGKPFLLPHGNLMIAGELLSAAPQPMDQQQRMRLASEKLLEERRTNSMRKMLDSYRAAAKMDYQSGFAPPPAGETGGE
jgi:EpsD family peptidyl-prolyl cis-trans isomerase